MKSSLEPPTALPIGRQPSDGTQPGPVVRILLVEDCPHQRQQSMEVLVRSGYLVDAVHNGDEAWAALQRTGYDLLLTDHNMPKEEDHIRSVAGQPRLRRASHQRSISPAILISGAM